MARINKTCIGDCSRCELLANGEVDMVPCVLDQIFQRTQRLEQEMRSMKDGKQTKREITFIGAAGEDEPENENTNE